MITGSGRHQESHLFFHSGFHSSNSCRILSRKKINDPANNPVADYLIFGVTMLFNLVTEFIYQKYFVFNDKKSDKTEEK